MGDREEQRSLFKQKVKKKKQKNKKKGISKEE